MLNTAILSAQFTTNTNLSFNGNFYDVFIVKVDAASSGKFNIIEKEKVDSTSIDSSFFFISASIIDSSCKPLGYYFKNSQEIQPVNLNNGKGNFYLKPNGVLLILSDKAVVCESSQMYTYQDIKLGIQSGPLLVCNDTINSNFNPNSVNKLKRCGVGLKKNKKGDTFLVFAISRNQISFYDFALFFKQKFNCKNALCLESGVCALSLPYEAGVKEELNKISCNILYYKTK